MVTKGQPRERVAPRGYGAHTTIGAALRAAVDGAVVSVMPGLYRESVVISRPVTLVAEKGMGTVRLAAAHGPALRLTAAVGRVADLLIEGQQGQPGRAGRGRRRDTEPVRGHRRARRAGGHS